MGNTGTTLRPEALSDLRDTTAFTAEEIRQYYKDFLSECEDGRMSMSESDLNALYSKYFPEGDASKFSAIVFKTLDEDGTGRVDFREFLVSLNVQVKGTFEDKLDWTFDLFDIDNTGYIDKQELQGMVKAMDSLRGSVLPAEDTVTNEQLVDYVMKKADVDKNGKISRQEFKEAALTSKTIQRMLLGTLKATSSPFTQRKVFKK